MMKRFLIILVMVFWCSVGFAEIIKNRCFGYQGYGAFSTHRDSFEWVEIIDTEKRTYKWKAKGKNWNTQTEFFHFGDDNLSFRNPEGVDLNINFITFVTTYIGHQGYIQNDCVRETIAKKPTDTTPTPDDGKIIIIGSGSGFFINEKGYIVSNAHVIGVCKKVIAYEEGEEITLKILATDMVNDIGLVKGKFNNKQYLNIKTDGAELGEQIVTFGYPLSQDLSDSVKLTQGIVSSLSGPDNNYSQIQIDAAIQPGNSGGPVLNMNGQVVGIASAGLSKLYMAAKAAYIPENVNFAVAAQSLTTFLKANKVKVTSGPTKIYSTKELAKIGEPATIQLFCMNTKAEYAKLKEADKHSDVLLDLK